MQLKPFWIIASMVLMAVAGCQGRHSHVEDRVITDLDDIAAGLHGLAQYLRDADPAHASDVRATSSRAERSIVSVTRVLAASRWSESTALSTGLVIGEGIVLTAGHLVGDDAPSCRLRVKFAKLVTNADVVASRLRSDEDWALLRVTIVSGASVLPLGRSAIGDIVVGSGFPLGYGLSKEGVIVNVQGVRTTPRPVPFIARVLSTDPLELQLIAGSLPPQGMSGSPLLNLEGELIGLVSGTSERYEEGRYAALVITGTGVEAFEESLRAVQAADRVGPSE